MVAKGQKVVSLSPSKIERPLVRESECSLGCFSSSSSSSSWSLFRGRELKLLFGGKSMNMIEWVILLFSFYQQGQAKTSKRFGSWNLANSPISARSILSKRIQIVQVKLGLNFNLQTLWMWIGQAKPVNLLGFHIGGVFVCSSVWSFCRCCYLSLSLSLLPLPPKCPLGKRSCGEKVEHVGSECNSELGVSFGCCVERSTSTRRRNYFLSYSDIWICREENE